MELCVANTITKGAHMIILNHTFLIYENKRWIHDNFCKRIEKVILILFTIE